MKITFVMATCSLAGGDRVIATYAKRLQQRGHEVLVVSQPPSKPDLTQQVKSLLKGKGWIVKKQNLPTHIDNANIPHKVLESCRPPTDADVPDADVVIATWWETAEWVANLSASKGAKAYFLQHYEAFDYMPKERVSATWFLPLHKIAVAQWLVDLAENKYGDRQVSLVPNSVDTEQFYAPPRGKQLTPTIGVMYGPTYWKGCDICLDAYSLAAEKIPNLRLVVLSVTEPFADLPLPAGATLSLRPPQDQIKHLYSQCDAWLFGSRSEGFGLPILEAMACRTPVIGTPAGAAPELLADNAGILVKPEDPQDMALAIERICQMSDAEWQAMSDAANSKVTKYTLDRATDLFEAALYRAIERWQQGDLLNYAVAQQ